MCEVGSLQRCTSNEVYEIVPNLRDIGSIDNRLKKHKVYRCSQAYNKNVLDRLGLKSVIDLRAQNQCGKCPLASGCIFLKKSESQMQMLEQSESFRSDEHEPVKIHQVNMIPKRLKFWILYQVPRQVKYNLVRAVCQRKNPEEVMAPAVANPQCLGFCKFYIAILEKSRRALRQIMSICADESNYPLLIHCVHGKDRTGIVVMLLLMLCDVPQEAIIADYVKSERELNSHRTAKNLNIQEYLLEDSVISANSTYIEVAIQHIQEKYGNIDNYLQYVGVPEQTIRKIRQNLIKEIRQ